MIKSERGMAVVPTMMVLYTNDAVDVRYSDGSLLQLSPCGSSMFHQDPPSPLPKHPLAGVQGVQKWTQFVTSAHKSKVLQAVDFRNRFACRPFLCPALMPAEDIVSLYAKIDQVAWGRSAEESHIEVFEDGSRRAVSLDEYASLVLSPHGQDFTVCYLSRISPDTVGTGSAHQSQHSSPQGHGVSFTDSSIPSDSPRMMPENPGEKIEDQKPADSEPVAFHDVSKVSDEAVSNSDCPHSSEAVLNRNCNNSTPVNEISVSGEITANASGLILSDGTVSTPGRTGQQGDLQSSAFSVQHDISSISRVSTPDGLRGMVDCDDTLNEETRVNPPPSSTDILHSSPLNQVNTWSRTDQAGTCTDSVGTSNTLKENEAAAQKSKSMNTTPQQVLRVVPTVRDEDGSRHSSLNREDRGMIPAQSTRSVGAEEADQKPQSIKDAALEQVCKMQSFPGHPQPHSDPLASGEKIDSLCQDKAPQTVVKNPDRHGAGGSRGAYREETWSSSRHHYTWVTQHISCNSCPAAWRHPLRLLQQTDPTDSILASECNLTVSSNIAKGLQKGGITDARKCVASSLASPLPLSCPFQHLHEWQSPHGRDRESSAEPVSKVKQGQLKVLMMEGVIYRFVDVANMKIVEIYPGDGSVLISQGTTASFFSHLMWKDGKLEEKSYSVKMLPPHSTSALYSVQNLIKRGHRLLTGCIHNGQLSQREDLPCWKRAVTQVVEPLSSSLLEECSVPAYGRFQAYSNGRVRVVFEDRTTLDMMADFSQRLQGCVKHSSDSLNSMEENLAAVKLTSRQGQLQCSQCRLLLPSGKYIMVEALKPGQYRRYVDAAKEWIQWVQSSPKERRQFYHNKATPHSARVSAEVELKKIECFNYIVDHSSITTSATHTASSPLVLQPEVAALQPPVSQYAAAYASSDHAGPLGAASASLQYPTTSQAVPYHAHTLGQGIKDDASLGLSASSNFFTSDPKDQDMIQGFSSVREALLRTSKMIQEIDDIVKDCKESSSSAH